MTCESLSNLAELNYLWKHRGNKNYNLISLVSKGNFTRYMVFEDQQNNRKLVGKIVTFPREGEAYHWPRLLHENLAPLLEIVAINEATSVYIFQSVGSSLRNVIHDDGFQNDSDCFDRKKAYAGDILWALDYLHQKSLCIMNLSETIICICDAADKAVLCDFSCVVLIQRASKENMKLPFLYQAPEVDSGYFQPLRVETWTCGVILLQVFAQHRLPSSFIGDKVHPILKSIAEINYDIIKEANPGSSLRQSDIVDLKSFLGLFLAQNPDQRADVQLAAVSPFLRHSKRKSASENVDLRKRLEKSNTNAFFSLKTTSEREHDHLRKLTTFNDIYLTEAAMYKDKLGRSPSTNKFINLDYIPNCTEEKNSSVKPYDVKESSRDVTNVTAHETSRESVLPIKNNPKIPVINERKETIPEVFQNESHDLHSKSVEVNNNNISSELWQNNSGDVVDSAFQNWRTCECYLDAERLCEDATNNNHNQFAPGDDFASNKNKHHEFNFNSPYETDMSTDSLDILENTEIDLSRKLELNSHRYKIKRNLHEKGNELCLHSQNDIEFSKNKLEANLYRVKSESNMDNIHIKNTNLTSFRSDSYLVDYSTERSNETESGSSGSIVLSSNSDTNTSRQIVVLGSSDLHKEPDSETEGYKWKCHGNSYFKKDARHQIFHTNTPTPSVNSLSLQSKSQNIDDFWHQNGNNSSEQQQNLLQDKDTQRGDACNQHEVDNVTFPFRRNSYKQAMSNELKDTTKPDASKHTDAELLNKSKVKKKSKTSLFRKRKTTSISQKSCSSLSPISDLQYFSGDKSDVSNVNLVLSSDLGSMETSLLNTNMRKRTTKKAKKTWIQCLCLGGKT